MNRLLFLILILLSFSSCNEDPSNNSPSNYDCNHSRTKLNSKFIGTWAYVGDQADFLKNDTIFIYNDSIHSLNLNFASGINFYVESSTENPDNLYMKVPNDTTFTSFYCTCEKFMFCGSDTFYHYEYWADGDTVTGPYVKVK